MRERRRKEARACSDSPLISRRCGAPPIALLLTSPPMRSYAVGGLTEPVQIGMLGRCTGDARALRPPPRRLSRTTPIPPLPPCPLPGSEDGETIAMMRRQRSGRMRPKDRTNPALARQSVRTDRIVFRLFQSREATRSAEGTEPARRKLVINTRREKRERKRAEGSHRAASCEHVRAWFDQLMDIRPNSCVRSSGSGVASRRESGLRGGGRDGSMLVRGTVAGAVCVAN